MFLKPKLIRNWRYLSLLHPEVEGKCSVSSCNPLRPFLWASGLSCSSFLQSPNWDGNEQAQSWQSSCLCSLVKAQQGVQCPLLAEGRHRWAPGLWVGLLPRRAATGGQLHTSFASVPVARGFQAEPCQETNGLGSHQGSRAAVSPEEGGDSGPPSGGESRGRRPQKLALRFF